MRLPALLRRLLTRLLRRRRGDAHPLARLAGDIARALPPDCPGPLHVAYDHGDPVLLGAHSAHARLALAPALDLLAVPRLAQAGYVAAHLPQDDQDSLRVITLILVRADGSVLPARSDSVVG